MADNTLNVKVKQRYDTASNWSSADPVLLKGEIAISSDQGMFKVGDGTSKWSALSYNKANTANSASTATKATQDSAGQQINTTYIKGLSASGTTITYTKGDGSTGTITTQDTNTDTKVTNTLDTTTKAYVTGTTSSTTNTGTQIFDTGVYLDTTAGQLTASTFKGALSGNADTATALTSSAGTATQPVYFSSGKPVACTYTLGKSVPSTALFTDTTYSDMTGATSSDAGTHGLVPAPAAGNQAKFLRGDGTWATPTDTNTDTKVTQTVTTTSANYPLLLAPSGQTANATTTSYFGTKFQANPSTGVLTATTFSGSGASLTSLNASNVSSGTLSSDRLPTVPVSKGGTGATTLTSGAVLIGNGTSAVTTRAIDTTTGGTSGSTALITSGAVYSGLSTKAASSHTHSYLPLSGGTMTGQIQKAGISSSWYNGRSNAVIRMNSSNGYSPILSAKTTDGSWEIGTYTSNKLHFVHITDTNFDDGTNTATANISMGIDGSITANNFIGNATTATTAATATKLGSSTIGSATQPIYLNGGTATACTYTLGKSVPSSAVFTDTTYSAGTGLSLSGTTFNHSNSVTAGTAQGDATKTLSFGGTFTIPTVTYDAQGHITGKGTTTMTMPSNPNTDTKVTISTTNPTSATTYYPTWATGATTGTVSINNGMVYTTLEGTTSAAGYGILKLGNSTASGTAANKYGRLYIYSTSSGFGYLSQASTTSSVSHVLPATGGTILNTGTTSWTASLSSGTAIGTLKINGSSYTLYCQTNTNTTYSAGTGLALSGTTFNHSNSVTAATAQGDASKTLSFGGTFTIPTITYDAQGHITAKGTTTMTMPANPNSDTKVTQTVSTTSASYPLLLAPSGQTATTTTTAYFGTKFQANPSTGVLTATTFSGSGASLTSLNASNVSSGTLSSDRLPTVPVSKGGTGATTLTSGAALIGNGTSAVSLRSITNMTSKSYITYNTNLMTTNTLAYWNGAYNSSGNSNLTYCNQGAFGVAATKAVDTVVTYDSSNLITSGAVYSSFSVRATTGVSNCTYSAASSDGVTYTATVPAFGSLTAGISFIMVPQTSSTSTTPTLNVTGMGAKTIKRRLSNMSSSQQSGYATTWLTANHPYRMVYDGTYWIVEGQSVPVAADLYGTVPVSKGGTGKTTLTSGYALIGNGTSAVSLRAIDTTSGGTSGSTSLITSGAVNSAISELNGKFTNMLWGIAELSYSSSSQLKKTVSVDTKFDGCKVFVIANIQSQTPYTGTNLTNVVGGVSSGTLTIYAFGSGFVSGHLLRVSYLLIV